ncbi:Coiled-coil domain-containing protein 77 [Physocladia obscura]|uniref:Coiled-coil domain-containing protein 77 n=1 Tax=Physocladia obscura TaxID=109957 RepID=A0AAD5T4B8_9FUNG|nr:Coiled-coil domain-containing protein 77 [Physocladia obscura]
MAVSAAAAMAMADNNISLVEYYRSRLGMLGYRFKRVEADFQDSIDKVESLKISHRDHHELAWQVHRREAEVAEIQQALSDAQVQVFDERKQLLRIIAENDQLKIQELKDRKKIRYLLSITGNLEPEITYFRDRLDKRLVKIGSEDGISKLPPSALATRISAQDRDIIILEDEIESMKLTISSLQTQLEEQKKSYEEIIIGLHRDRQTLLEEEQIRRAHESKKMEQLLDKNDNLRQLNRENVRELLHLKKSQHQNERRLVEEKMKLTNEILELKAKYAEEKDRVDRVERVVEAKLLQKHDDVATDLRIQLQRSEDELRVHKKKIETLEKGTQKRTQVMDNRIEILTKNYNSLRRRRDYEIEGFTNDILLLRKQLKVLEKSILKYGPLEDRELVLLNLARETSNRAAQISSDLHGLKSKMMNAENDLRTLIIP